MTAYNQSYKQLEIKVNTNRGDMTKSYCFYCENLMRNSMINSTSSLTVKEFGLLVPYLKVDFLYFSN